VRLDDAPGHCHVAVYLATPKSMSWRNTLPPFSLA
jgi:hypothetical protein